MNKTLHGGCLCEAVSFTVKDDFSAFYHCHCRQCQQLTGSAFASNIFTAPGNIQWLKGESNVSLFVHPTRTFSRAFCQDCGSALPFVTKSGKALIVPAGCLHEEPSIKPQANIFAHEQTTWFQHGKSAPQYHGFVE